MPHKIMVIEDDPVIRSELQTLLRADGFEACAVTDFDRTIRQVKAEDPHLILLDVKLPGKSGYYLCSEIRSFSDVPIIFVTSNSTHMDELNSIMMGGDAFITKQEDPQQGPMRTESVIRFLTEDMGEYVTLSIQDNGMGIDAADLPRVFEKGYTGENGRKVQHSTGLGLYLCKKLCGKLGIRIEIESGTVGDRMENGEIQQTGTIQQIGTTVKLTFYLNHLIHEVQEK